MWRSVIALAFIVGTAAPVLAQPKTAALNQLIQAAAMNSWQFKQPSEFQSRDIDGVEHVIPREVMGKVTILYLFAET